jgi:hypothetical protein
VRVRSGQREDWRKHPEGLQQAHPTCLRALRGEEGRAGADRLEAARDGEGGRANQEEMLLMQNIDKATD